MSFALLVCPDIATLENTNAGLRSLQLDLASAAPASSGADALTASLTGLHAAVIPFADGRCTLPLLLEILGLVTARSVATFVLIHDAALLAQPKARLALFDAGAHCLAHTFGAIEEALRRLREQTQIGHGARVDCPLCSYPQLTEFGLRLHGPLYHAMRAPPVNPAVCPLCGLDEMAFHGRSWALHLNNQHGDPAHREPARPAFAAFSWVLCRSPATGRFLLVHEPAALCDSERPGYWLPAGRLDAGETFLQAAERETLEEAGVRCRITGLLQIKSWKTPRLVFLAEPVQLEEGDATPKSIPDWESCGAVWLDAEQVATLSSDDCRSDDPLTLIPEVVAGRRAAKSLDTPAFAALESAIASLTASANFPRCASQTMAALWRQLEETYGDLG